MNFELRRTASKGELTWPGKDVNGIIGLQLEVIHSMAFILQSTVDSSVLLVVLSRAVITYITSSVLFSKFVDLLALFEKVARFRSTSDL